MFHVQLLHHAGPRTTGLAAAILLAAVAASAAQRESAVGAASTSLANTSWQLVRFQGGDDRVLTPDDRAKYTIAFDAKGFVSARIDCNRGRSTWTSSGTSQLQFGPLALTRALCPAGSMHDQIVKQWGNVRSYVLKGGRLYLSLMADGGIFEFEPAPASAPAPAQPPPIRSAVRATGPSLWTCSRAAAPADTLRVTFYATQPGLVLLERGAITRPAFQVKAASGGRYEGDDVLFWEARGQAMLNWMGTEATCRRK